MRVNTRKGISTAVIIIALLVLVGGGYAVKKVDSQRKERKGKTREILESKRRRG